MKHLTKDLTGALLDAAVAKADCRFTVANNGEYLRCYARDGDPDYSAGELVFFMPSTCWADGGPIIEREFISLRTAKGHWYGDATRSRTPAMGWGYFPLIAAMRAYVASKLGEEVELP